MDPITTSALIYGGTALAGIGSQAGANYKNRKMMREGQEFEKEMWNMSNQYNSPSAQMERLRSAGLNPNLVYGTGTVAGNTAPASQPKAHVAQVESVMKNTQPFEYMNTLSAYQSIQNQKEQNRAIKAQADLTEYKIETERYNTILRQIQGLNLNQDYNFKSVIQPFQKSYLLNNIKKLENDTKQQSFNLETMNPLKKSEMEKRIALMGADEKIKAAEIKLKQAQETKVQKEIKQAEMDLFQAKEYKNSIMDVTLDMLHKKRSYMDENQNYMRDAQIRAWMDSFK